MVKNKTLIISSHTEKVLSANKSLACKMDEKEKVSLQVIKI